MTEFDVLIVGGGPSGLMLANELGVRGVKCLLLDAKPSTAFNPQANATQARTMEHYRRLGFAHEIRALGLPGDHPTDIAYFTRLTGYELARLSLPTAQEAVEKIKTMKGSWSAAELPHRVSQKFVETVLKQHAQSHPSNDIRYAHRLIDFEDQGDCVVARFCATDDPDNIQTVNVKYMVAGDGPKSSVRHALGISYTGETGVKRSYMGGQMFAVYMRSKDLYQHMVHPRAWMYVTVNPKRRGFLASVDGKEEFAFHSAVDESENPEHWGDIEARQLLLEFMGCKVDFEILSIQTWTAGHSLVAEKFQHGRVFLMGDAAHLFTPTGGLGYNTAIEDAVNLGWKLASAIARPELAPLLQTYEIERRPLAIRNTNYAKEFADSVGLYPVTPAIEADSPEGQAERESAGVHFNAHVRKEFNIPGVTFGGRYDNSPIILSDGSTAPVDQANTYTPTATPGGRPPHAWLKDGSSLYDHFGRNWTLLNFTRDRALEESFKLASKRLGVDLKCLQPSQEDDLDLQALYQAHWVIVRPDQIVAFRHPLTATESAPEPEIIWQRLLATTVIRA
jgi:2-polyprenyl-6-methoxyphenol hydroxylase-like FAD-dependent oxidoreductase